MKQFYTLATIVLLNLITLGTIAQGYWFDEVHPVRADQMISPSEYRSLRLDRTVLASLLATAPLEAETPVRSSSAIISIPMPDGSFQQFRYVESSIMAPELQSRYPFIRTYLGQGVDDPTAIIRFDLTPKGFHGMILRHGQTVYIDPVSMTDDVYYMSYAKASFYANTDKVFNELPPVMPDHIDAQKYDQAIERATHRPEVVAKEVRTMGMGARTPFGAQLRTYDLALACTGEYAQFHGGTVALALAAMVTSMNRVNGVYERDATIRMILVPNNDQIVYTNAATDPYTNNSGATMLNENQTNINAVIGSANYDIGHVYSTGGGGIAQLQSPCGTGKARGVTGQPTPVGDPFDIDYVCHEMGHQYGGNHTQNNSCNRAASAAFEPGSASTIMGYAGICAPNLQSNSDDHFHNHSINEMYNFVVNGNGSTCATTTNTGNTPPTVNAGVGGWTIPLSTPFELTAVGSDVDGDAITYNWEEYDLGPATAGGDVDLTNPSGTQPIFRSWPSTTSPTRVFPRITELVNNTAVIGEFLPDYARSMTFRCTVRDNVAGAGGVNDDEVSFSVTDQAGPFLVTAPNTAVVWPGNSFQTITWDVANTNAAPVNCSNVDIYLSVDGGLTYPTLVLANTPNDGSEVVLIPSGETNTARIKVKASNSIFFDISNNNFTIGPAVGANDIDAGILAVTSPAGDYCGDTATPELSVANFGTLDLTSFDVVYNVDGGASSTFSWTGSLATGESVNIVLPDITAAAGAHSFNVEIQNPNGTADDNPTNNSASSSFSFTPPPAGYSCNCDNVLIASASGTGGVSTDVTFDAGGTPTVAQIELDWVNIGGGGSWPADVALQITDPNGNCLEWGGYDLSIGCGNTLGNYTVWPGSWQTSTSGIFTATIDLSGFGLTGNGSWTLTILNGWNTAGNVSYDFTITFEELCIGAPSTTGCTNPVACNYDPTAITDDGSCILPDGCTNPSACNFDPAATCDDGSCVLPDGCTNPAACNYDPAASCDDGSCVLPNGCTDSAACNYDPSATCDDGSCILPDGCTNPAACNFNPAATCDDGSCQLPDGCTDPAACNYDLAAGCDDGSCTYGTTWYEDADLDGFGSSTSTLIACSQPAGYVTDNNDCNDGNNAVYPGAPGTAEGIDNNCNGVIDAAEALVCDGDFNGDGLINIADLLILLSEYGCTSGCSADMNGDGSVSQADGLAFFAVFGTSCQ